MDWRKSSLSGDSGNCVQVRQDLAAIRDSKNPTGPTLAADLSGLLATITTRHDVVGQGGHGPGPLNLV